MATPVPKWNIRQKTLINNVGMVQQWSLAKKDKKSDVTSSPWGGGIPAIFQMIVLIIMLMPWP